MRKEMWTLAAALTLCAGLVLTMEKQPRYETAAVEVRQVSQTIEAVGTVSYERVYPVMPQAAGQVARVFVEQGDAVRQGQAIAEMQWLPQGAAWMAQADEDAALAEEALKALTVTAPVDGVVLSLPAYVGMQAAPGSALGSVAASARVVTALIPESAREQVEVGSRARISRNGRSVWARVTGIQPSAEAAGQYAVTLGSTGFSQFEPGMKVDVAFTIQQRSAPAVPLAAVRADGTVLCLTESGGAAAVPVQVGLCDAMYAQLTQGPPVGSLVVLGEEADVG